MNVADIYKGFSFVATNKKRMCDEIENNKYLMKSLTQNHPSKLKSFLNKFNRFRMS
jgi:hypothetical protein